MKVGTCLACLGVYQIRFSYLYFKLVAFIMCLPTVSLSDAVCSFLILNRNQTTVNSFSPDILRW